MQRGDESGSFENFVRVEGPALLVFATSLCGNRHDAWDLTQESLARVGERWHRQEIDVPAAYVRTVMARLNVDRIRRLRREVLGWTGAEPGIAMPSDTGTLGQELLNALPLLSPRQRTALALRYIEDLSVRDIAARMNCSEGTVKSTLSRGLERLRTRMRPMLHPEPDYQGR